MTCSLSHGTESIRNCHVENLGMLLQFYPVLPGLGSWLASNSFFPLKEKNCPVFTGRQAFQLKTEGAGAGTSSQGKYLLQSQRGSLLFWDQSMQRLLGNKLSRILTLNVSGTASAIANAPNPHIKESNLLKGNWSLNLASYLPFPIRPSLIKVHNYTLQCMLLYLNYATG